MQMLSRPTCETLVCRCCKGKQRSEIETTAYEYLKLSKAIPITDRGVL
jgi:hypothetical protein